MAFKKSFTLLVATGTTPFFTVVSIIFAHDCIYNICIYLYVYIFLIVYYLGFGSIGTILEGPIIAFIASRFGWGGSFYLMIALTIVSAVAMCKAAYMNDKDIEAANSSTI